jgi:hypothetical protein
MKPMTANAYPPAMNGVLVLALSDQIAQLSAQINATR